MVYSRVDILTIKDYNLEGIDKMYLSMTTRYITSKNQGRILQN